MLDSAVVDSVMTVFNQGVQGAILTYMYPAMGVVATFVVISLITHAIRKG